MKKTKVTSSLKGHLLLALPHLQDDVFGQSAILICSHDTDGAVGLIINRPLESVTFLELLSQFHIKGPKKFEDRPIFFGGPVDVNRGFILHSTRHMMESSVAVNKEIALTANLSFFKDFVIEETQGEMIVALGYAGWSAGQLEQELKNGQWIHVQCTKEILFEPSHDQKCKKAFDALGVTPAYISPRTGTA